MYHFPSVDPAERSVVVVRVPEDVECCKSSVDEGNCEVECVLGVHTIHLLSRISPESCHFLLSAIALMMVPAALMAVDAIVMTSFASMLFIPFHDVIVTATVF